jgi:ribosomal protein S18 acetylase RimI-like enzyme
MGEITSRPANAGDYDFLAQMLVYASNFDPERRQYSLEELLADPMDAPYVTDWMRPDDAGVVLEDDGQPAGAAWWRLAPGPGRIYGWEAADVPVIGIALDPDHRDRGFGRRLMTELMQVARERGYSRVSLGVENDNKRGKHLYLSLGFVDVREEGEDATVMVAPL